MICGLIVLGSILKTSKSENIAFFYFLYSIMVRIRVKIGVNVWVRVSVACVQTPPDNKDSNNVNSTQ